jgi:Flp pilus assembly protein CpaB
MPAMLAGGMVSRHRRRAIVLAVLAAALAIGGLVELGRGSAAPRRERMATEVVAIRDVPAGARLSADVLGVVRVPARYANRGAVGDPRSAIGLRAAVALPAGALLLQPELSRDDRIADARDVAVRVDDAAGLPSAPLAGAHADVLLVRPGREAPAVVLSDVLVVAARTTDGAAVATLRLAAADVSTIVAAEGCGSLRLAVRTAATAP